MWVPWFLRGKSREYVYFHSHVKERSVPAPMRYIARSSNLQTVDDGDRMKSEGASPPIVAEETPGGGSSA